MSFYLKTSSLLFGSLSSVNLLRMLSLLLSSCYGMRSWVLGQFFLCIMCQLWLQDLSSSPAYILVHGCCMIPKAEFGSLPTLLQKAVITRDKNVDFWYKKKLVISSLLQNTFWTKEHVHVSKGSPSTVGVSAAPSQVRLGGRGGGGRGCSHHLCNTAELFSGPFPGPFSSTVLIHSNYPVASN